MAMEIDGGSWRHRSMQRRGELIEWVNEPIEGCGCEIISVQKMSESWDRRLYPELFAPKRKGKRNA